ncbi:MAG: MobF family relaxase, partial [Acetobacteraceae bacterium]
ALCAALPPRVVGREIAGLFREGEAVRALAMKRADGHAMLVGGDRGQVVARIADVYIARRDILLGSSSQYGITVSAPTNNDVAEISEAIRARLKERGEISADEIIHPAIDLDGHEFDLALAAGDRVRLFRRTWGTIDGREQQVGNNGEIVEVLAQRHSGMRIRTQKGEIADVEWRRFMDAATGKLLLGFGHALTMYSAQGVTSDEHINALPRGTAGVSAFTTYVAESRSRGTTWTMISEGALFEAERHRQALGDITPITTEDLWARAASDMSEKPYKGLGIDLLATALRDRERAVDIFVECQERIESAQLADPEAGPKAFRRLRAAAINDYLARHLQALDHAMQANAALIRDIVREREARDHLRALRAEAAETARRLEEAGAELPRPSKGPSPGG